MPTITIDDKLYQNLIKYNVEIEDTLQKAVDAYQKIPMPTNEEIKKIVETSQRIEGYQPMMKEIEEEVEKIMEHYNVQVSF